MSKSKTYTGGANALKSLVIDHVRRERVKALKKGETTEDGPVLNADRLLGWLLTCDERYQKQAGGLGK